jgi:hypothetical protein
VYVCVHTYLRAHTLLPYLFALPLRTLRSECRVGAKPTICGCTRKAVTGGRVGVARGWQVDLLGW